MGSSYLSTSLLAVDRFRAKETRIFFSSISSVLIGSPNQNKESIRKYFDTNFPFFFVLFLYFMKMLQTCKNADRHSFSISPFSFSCIRMWFFEFCRGTRKRSLPDFPSEKHQQQEKTVRVCLCDNNKTNERDHPSWSSECEIYVNIIRILLLWLLYF